MVDLSEGWSIQGRPGVRIETDVPDINQIVVAFWAAAEQMYPKCKRPERKHPTGELGNYFDAIRVL